MQPKRFMVFAKVKIICHGARALRIGERLLHKIRKQYGQSFENLKLDSLISYPDDMQKLDTECDAVVQIAYEPTTMCELERLNEKYKRQRCITFVLGEKSEKATSLCFCASENELFSQFIKFYFQTEE